MASDKDQIWIQLLVLYKHTHRMRYVNKTEWDFRTIDGGGWVRKKELLDLSLHEMYAKWMYDLISNNTRVLTITNASGKTGRLISSLIELNWNVWNEWFVFERISWNYFVRLNNGGIRHWSNQSISLSIPSCHFLLLFLFRREKGASLLLSVSLLHNH